MKKEKTMKTTKTPISLVGIIVAAAIFFLSFWMGTPLNAHAIGLWITIIFATFAYAVASLMKSLTQKNHLDKGDAKPFLIPAVVILATIIAGITGAEIFHANAYSSILTVEDAEITDDLPDAEGTDSIALMDTASAEKLGDREIGSLSSVVSQYEVSSDYTQIDYQGSPEKVSALQYAGFLKWFNNRASGVPGYVTVDPVTMSASYEEVENGMIYVPSACFLQEASRHIHLAYPSLIFGNLHFEIDEEGNPYYIATIYEKTIGLFGGETVSGCIILDPVTGSTEKCDLADVPTWVDDVYDGDTICTQYNWYGTLKNGWVNSHFGKKGCKKVTSYRSSGDEGDEDDSLPISDYGYVAKDGDIWIYTGVTSVNSDSSNIGFLMANERTGEAHYYSVSGADESSAMGAAEGEVQEKGYQASFPSLINVDGNPTYIMVLKDNSGLVKLYAAVNVEQYNIVTTASTQKECLSKYRALLGIVEEGGDIDEADLDEAAAETEASQDSLEPTDELDITIKEIRDIDIDGNTYVFLISEEDQIYKEKVADDETVLLLNVGDTVHLVVHDNIVLSWTK